MDGFLNRIKAQSSQLDQSWAQPRLGLVSSVNSTDATVRVMIQPENVLSGWLPVSSIWVGAAWGMVCLPSPGDQVLVLFQEGDSEHGIVVGGLWSATRPPPTVPSGELWIVHKSGSFLKLTNDGSIVSEAASWKHTGNLSVSGNVSDAYGSLADLRQKYNMHVHPPQTSSPNPLD